MGEVEESMVKDPGSKIKDQQQMAVAIISAHLIIILIKIYFGVTRHYITNAMMMLKQQS